MKLYQKIAQHIEHGIAIEFNPAKYPTAQEIFDKTEEQIKNALPSGSGFDDKIRVDYKNSKPDKIVLIANFHHMDDNGYYDGWSYHNIIITPSLSWSFNLRITGQNRRDIKSYIADCAHHFLNEEV